MQQQGDITIDSSTPVDVNVTNAELDVNITNTELAVSLGPTLAASSTPTAVSVGTASTALVAANADRKYLLIQNNGSVDLFITPGATASLTDGIKIAAGGAYEAPLGMAERQWAGIVASSTADVRLMIGTV